MSRAGQTFRALLGALQMASEGKTVIYECRTPEMARWTFDKAVRLVLDFMDPETPERLLLKIGEGGVRFTSRLSAREVSRIENSESGVLISDV